MMSNRIWVTLAAGRSVSPALLTAILAAALLAGCSNTFRPVAVPILQPGGDPGIRGNAIVLAINGVNPGTTTHIDTSGDTVAAVHTVGITPIHAGFTAIGTVTYVANRDQDTVSSYVTAAGPGASVTTVTLTTGAKPVFVHSRDGANVYVAESGLGKVGVISQASLIETAEVIVGNNPVAISELPNLTKVYVANQADGTVSVFGVPGLASVATVTVGSSPDAIDVSADSAYVFVANYASGTVSVINTSTDTLEATNGTIAVGVYPTFLRYDATLKRVYVVNNGSSSVSIIDADPASPAFLTSVVTPVQVGSLPTSLTVLANGTRVYVANSNSGTVSVISASSNAVIATLSLVDGSFNAGSNPVSIASSSDNLRVFVANQGSATFPPSVTIIRTSDNAQVATFNMPQQNPACTTNCLLQTPVLVLATP